MARNDQGRMQLQEGGPYPHDSVPTAMCFDDDLSATREDSIITAQYRREGNASEWSYIIVAVILILSDAN